MVGVSKKPPVKPSSGRVTGLAPISTSPNAPRWFWPSLVLCIALAAGSRALLLQQHLAQNPFARYLRVDARTYWDWAGRIAAGHWTDGLPYFSAPLYPHLVALVRLAGGDPAVVYTLQIVLDLSTALFVALVARRRFRPEVGLVSAVLLLLLMEPAAYSVRVLASTIQLPLVCLAWLALVRLAERPKAGTSVLAGAALGLLALVFAPAVTLLPVAGVWIWWVGGHGRKALAPTVVVLASGLAVVAPATIHNYAACGEFIPISAQAGVTFAQGNAPGGDGRYHTLLGVSGDRSRQNLDAMRLYQQATGGPPNWRAVDGFFLQRGLDFWRANPLTAITLIGRKAYWYLTSCNYGEIVVPTIEAACGLLPRLWLTPLHTAWLIPLALVAALAWLRRPSHYAPELMLFGLPVVVVLFFFYSPRYRFPAIPLIVVAAAWVLCQAVRGRWRSYPTVAAAGAVLMTIALGIVNRATGFDSPASLLPLFHNSLAFAQSAAGDYEAAIRNYKRATELAPDLEEVELALADTLRRMGRLDECVAHAQHVLERNPESAIAHNLLGVVLMLKGRPAEAVERFRTAVKIDPLMADGHMNLGNTLTEEGALDAAMVEYREALRINPSAPITYLNIAILHRRRGDDDAAIPSLLEVLRIDPCQERARLELFRVYLQKRKYREAGAVLQEGHRLAPRDVQMAKDLAWFLATCPDPGARDGIAALRIAREVCERANHPTSLDTLAAAQAECGQFEEAVRTAAEAVRRAELIHDAALAAMIRARMELYQHREPYRETGSGSVENRRGESVEPRGAD